MHTELQWSFVFRSPSMTKLRAVQQELSGKFETVIQKHVPTIQEDREIVGPPLLAASRVAALKRDQVKSMASRFAKLAAAHGVEYEGVSSCRPAIDEDLLGWMDVHTAVWRLRHFSDCGLKRNDPVPFVFALTARRPEVLKQAASALRRVPDLRIGRVRKDKSRRDAPILLVRIAGKNNEPLLRNRYREMASAAKAGGTWVLGVQFMDG